MSEASPPPLDFTKPPQRGPVWKQRDGSFVLIEEMDELHLLRSVRVLFRRFKHFVHDLKIKETSLSGYTVVRIGPRHNQKKFKFREVATCADDPQKLHLFMCNSGASETYKHLVEELQVRGYTHTSILLFLVPDSHEEFVNGYPQSARNAAPSNKPPIQGSDEAPSIGIGSSQGSSSFEIPEPRSGSSDTPGFYKDFDRL